MAFLVVVAYSKHLHIGLAPLNIMFSRRPDALGPLEPMRSGGKVLDFEEADPEADVFGIGKVEDLTWKGLLDLGTCTECGRCQSQCPAWVTGKPLSPKQLILDLRDHAFAKAPYLLAGSDEERDKPAGQPSWPRRAAAGRDQGAARRHRPGSDVGVHELRRVRRTSARSTSSTSTTSTGCAATRCSIESAFPAEGDHHAQQPGAQGQSVGHGRGQAAGVDHRARLRGPRRRRQDPGGVEYLFWVGCAGALEDRAKKTTKAIAELLHTAGVSFAVLGPAETCTGDPARRLGNEFVFSMLAQQNIETLNDAGVAAGTGKKVIASCPHCFNTISREYPQLGGNYEVIHHTQLLAKLVGEGKLTPVTPVDEKITYHDPCFLGRHNKVYTPPRQLIDAVPGTQAAEMHRCKGKGFCCGAGGARMWLEERTGKRINTERIDEALALDPDTITTACPYCTVMLGDAVNAKKAAGAGPRPELEVIDVAQLLVRSVKLREESAGAAGGTETRRRHVTESGQAGRASRARSG